MSYAKPPTKAEKRAHLRGFVTEYARLMYPDDDTINGHPDNCQHCVGQANQAYRLAAKIVDLGIELGLYRQPTPRKISRIRT